jgi:5'(3')-deoxyribonucleotidase
MKEVPGAASALKFMNEIGEVFVVTASFDAYNWDLDRRMWLNTKFGIDKEHIIQTSAKHVVDGDLFIDDRPENIVSWIEAHPKGYALLWDLPHNHRFNLNNIDKYCRNRVERALSWPHIIYMIEHLKSRT